MKKGKGEKEASGNCDRETKRRGEMGERREKWDC